MNKIVFNILLMTIITYLTGCAKEKSHVSTDSPFKDNKLQIQKSSNQALISTNDMDLHVIVNNVCVKSLPAYEKENFLGDTIKVDLDKMLDIPVQAYILTIDNGLSEYEIEDVINSQDCVIGITNNDKVSIPENELTAEVSQNMDVSADGLSSYKHHNYLKYNEAKRTHFSSIFNRGKPVLISIIDSGVDLNHSDLRRIKDDSVNFTNDRDDRDYNGHGTHVAGLAASMLDFNPNAVRIMNAKALAASGSGYSSDIFNAIIYSVHNGADVINMSLSGSFDFSYVTYAEAISYAVRNNVFMVLAAGNSAKRVGNAYDSGDGSTQKQGPWPSALATMNGVVNVGSMDFTKNNQRSTFSNFGPNVDIWAPGCGNSKSRPFVGMPSAKVGGGYRSICGTSMASPVIAGIAALVIKHYRAQNKKIDITLLEEIIRISTKGSSSTNTGETNLTDLALRLKQNRVPQSPDFTITDAYGRYVSDLYAGFLVKPHLTEEVRILTEVFRNERRSFEWLIGQVLDAYPREIKDCRRVIRPLFYAASKRRQKEIEAQICNQFVGSNSPISRKDMISALIMSEGVLDHIEEIGLSHHPLAMTEKGKRIDINEYDLRKELVTLIPEILYRPAMLSDLKFTNMARSVQEVKNKILNSNDYFVFSLYKNVITRNVNNLFKEDFAGWSFWVSVLDKREQNRSQIENHFRNLDETWLRQAYRIHSKYTPYEWNIKKYLNHLQNKTMSREDIIEEIKNYERTGSTYTLPPMKLKNIKNEVFKIYYEEVDRYLSDTEKEAIAAPIFALNSNAKQKKAIIDLRDTVTNSKEAILVRIFYNVLRRGPYSQEREDHLRSIDNGTPWATIVDRIKREKPIDPNITDPNNQTEYAKAQIIDFYIAHLDRIPRTGGLNYWLSQFESGVSLEKIEWHISNSAESKIRSFYFTYLNRAPKSSGFNYWITQHKNGMSLDKVEWHFKNSPEYKIRSLYLLHYKREPDETGRKYWTNKLKVGLSLSWIKKQFQRSNNCKAYCL